MVGISVPVSGGIVLVQGLSEERESIAMPPLTHGIVLFFFFFLCFPFITCKKTK